MDGVFFFLGGGGGGASPHFVLDETLNVVYSCEYILYDGHAYDELTEIISLHCPRWSSRTCSR